MRLILSFLFFVLLTFTFLSAQSKDQYFLVHEEKAKTDQIPVYEKTSLEWIKLATEGSLDVPMRASMTDNFTYYYLMPLANYAELDGLNARFNAAMEKSGKEKWQSLFSEANPTIEYMKEYVVRHSDSYSYNMETSSAMPGEEFIHFDYFYVKPGKMKEVTELMKQWKDLYVTEKLTSGYDVWFAESGEDLNLVVVTESAPNAVEYYKRSAEFESKYGERTAPIWHKLLSCLRDFKHVNGRTRPDFSYQVSK